MDKVSLLGNVTRQGALQTKPFTMQTQRSACKSKPQLFFYGKEPIFTKNKNVAAGIMHQFISMNRLNRAYTQTFKANNITSEQKAVIQAIINVFETGKPLGDYGKVTLLKDDAGHLTYGRSQTTLASGNLYILIKAYCDNEDAQYKNELLPFLDRLQKKDLTLDNNKTLKTTLKKAGNDPVMKKTQDEFFDKEYYNKAVKRAKGMDISSPLGIAVVYDSYVHGSFDKIAKRTTAKLGKTSQQAGEKEWIETYVNERYNWLANHSNKLLRKTVYRMNTFKKLININNYPLIKLTNPAQKGEHIKKVQEILKEKGYEIKINGIYDKETYQIVRNYQKDNNLKVDGIIGNQTYKSLGMIEGNWQLKLPVKARSILITKETFNN